MTKQFVLNETLATLLFRAGYISIAPGSFIGLEADEVSTQEFRDAKTRGWISIHDTEPTEAMIKPIETVVIENPNKGMTAEELAAELGKGESKTDGVTIEALGQGAPAGSEAEATVEAIGQGTTEEIIPADLSGDAAPAPAPAPAPAKGRKAAK